MTRFGLGFFILPILFISTISFGQTTIWSENFSYPNGTTTGTDGKWSSSFSGNGATFSVQGGEFESSSSVSGNDSRTSIGTWTSEEIDIDQLGGYVEIAFDINWAFNTLFGKADAMVEVFYNIDSQGDVLLFSESNTTGDSFIDSNESGSSPISQILKGDNLVLTIRTTTTVESSRFWFFRWWDGYATSTTTWDNLMITKVKALYAIADGNWNENNVVWSDEAYDQPTQDPCDCAPTSGEITVVGNGTVVTVDSDQQAKALILEDGGVLNISGNTTIDITSAFLSVGEFSVIERISGNTSINFDGDFPSLLENHGKFYIDQLDFTSANNRLRVDNYGVLIINNGFSNNTKYELHNQPNSQMTMSETDFGDIDIYASYPGNSINFAIDGDYTIPTPVDGRYDNLVISGTGTKSVGDISVMGDINVSGNGILNVNGDLTLSGSVLQNVNGTINSQDLVINNTSGADPAIVLNGSISTSGNLTMTEGILYVSAASDLTINNSTSIGSPSSYVDGKVNTVVNANRRYILMFPIGNSGKWAPIEMYVRNRNKSFSVEYHKSKYSATNVDGISLVGVSTSEYWDINATANANADVKLYFMDKVSSGIIAEDDLTVAHFNGSAWENATVIGNGVLTYNTDKNWVQVTRVNDFSPFTFGSLSGSNPLPIELLSFDAEVTGDAVQINWATSTEINNEYFTIERSMDGQNWEAIGEILGAGNSVERLDYEYVDHNPMPGMSYYRLRQTDFDGQFEIFDPKAVIYDSENMFKVYPNPTVDVLKISTSNNLDEASIRVMNLQGQQESVNVTATAHSASIDMGHLATGIYIVEVIYPGSVISKRIVKK